MAKDADYRRLIHTTRWVKLRREVLTAHPLCQRCLKEGRIKEATEVHHVRPVEEVVTFRDKQSLMFDVHNLCALCHDCHVLTHKELGRSGRRANTERKERQTQDIVNRFFT